MRHPASVDLRRATLPTRSLFLILRRSPSRKETAGFLATSSTMPGSRACRLTYHMFQNYEPRTCIAIVSPHSHSFTDRTTKCPLISSLSLSLSYPLSLSFAPTLSLSFALSRSRSLIRRTKLCFRLHLIHVSHCQIRRSHERRSRQVSYHCNFVRSSIRFVSSLRILVVVEEQENSAANGGNFARGDRDEVEDHRLIKRGARRKSRIIRD